MTNIHSVVLQFMFNQFSLFFTILSQTFCSFLYVMLSTLICIFNVFKIVAADSEQIIMQQVSLHYNNCDGWVNPLRTHVFILRPFSFMCSSAFYLTPLSFMCSSAFSSICKRFATSNEFWIILKPFKYTSSLSSRSNTSLCYTLSKFLHIL